MVASMVHVSAKVKKWGNSLGIVIENRVSKELGLKPGELVDVDIFPKRKMSGFGIAKGVGGFVRERDEDGW